MSDSPPDFARMQSLEETVLHLQRHVEQLDQVVRSQSKELLDLARESKRVRDKLREIDSALTEKPRSLEDEKPPHY